MDLDMSVLRQLSADQQVPFETVLATVSAALEEAYARTPGAVADAAVLLDPDRGTLTITAPDDTDVTPADFGRLAAATARQAVVQWVRDVERVRKVGVWAGREGTLVSGTVRAHAARNRRGETILELGTSGVEAVMPAGEATPGEEYRHGQKLTVIILAVNADERGGVKVTVSRRQPTLVSALFTRAVPELADGRVEVVAIARDPGSRTKVAVRATVPGLDARGALLGAGAERIRRVVAELGPEKLDVLVHPGDLAGFAAAALTPARVLSAELVDPARKVVRVRVPGDQYALAMGRGGTNARLAYRLTGARVEVVPV